MLHCHLPHTCLWPSPRLCGGLKETRNTPYHRLYWEAICRELPHNALLCIRAHRLNYKEESFFFFIFMKEFRTSASHAQSQVASRPKSRTIESPTEHPGESAHTQSNENVERLKSLQHWSKGRQFLQNIEIHYFKTEHALLPLFFI